MQVDGSIVCGKNGVPCTWYFQDKLSRVAAILGHVGNSFLGLGNKVCIFVNPLLTTPVPPATWWTILTMMLDVLNSDLWLEEQQQATKSVYGAF